MQEASACLAGQACKHPWFRLARLQTLQIRCLGWVPGTTGPGKRLSDTTNVKSCWPPGA